MKFLLKICFTLTFAWLSFAGKANNDPTIIIKYPEEKKFSLLLHQLEQQAHTIQLHDQIGTCLLKENITDQSSFAKIYNLKNLPNGEYTLSIENEHKVLSQKITIEGSTIKIDTSNWKAIHKPHFVQTYNHLDLIFLQLENALTTIEIHNDAAEVIFHKEITTVGSICKRFNLENLAPGNYTFVVSVRDQVYQESISVKNLMAFQCTQ